MDRVSATLAVIEAGRNVSLALDRPDSDMALDPALDRLGKSLAALASAENPDLDAKIAEALHWPLDSHRRQAVRDLIVALLADERVPPS